jgi:hypothetical protein
MGPSNKRSDGIGLSLFVGYFGMVWTPNFDKKIVEPRKKPLAVLEAIVRAQRMYILKDSDGDGQKKPGRDLAELARWNLISGDFSSGVVEEYRYELRLRKDGWTVSANPVGWKSRIAIFT